MSPRHQNLGNLSLLNVPKANLTCVIWEKSGFWVIFTFFRRKYCCFFLPLTSSFPEKQRKFAKGHENLHRKVSGRFFLSLPKVLPRSLFLSDPVLYENQAETVSAWLVLKLRKLSEKSGRLGKNKNVFVDRKTKGAWKLKVLHTIRRLLSSFLTNFLHTFNFLLSLLPCTNCGHLLVWIRSNLGVPHLQWLWEGSCRVLLNWAYSVLVTRADLLSDEYNEIG